MQPTENRGVLMRAKFAIVVVLLFVCLAVTPTQAQGLDLFRVLETILGESEDVSGGTGTQEPDISQDGPVDTQDWVVYVYGAYQVELPPDWSADGDELGFFAGFEDVTFSIMPGDQTQEPFFQSSITDNFDYAIADALVPVYVIDIGSYSAWSFVDQIDEQEYTFSLGAERIGQHAAQFRAILDSITVKGARSGGPMPIVEADHANALMILESFDEILESLSEGIERAERNRSAHPSFLEFLRSTLEELQAVRDMTESEWDAQSGHDSWGDF